MFDIWTHKYMKAKAINCQKRLSAEVVTTSIRGDLFSLQSRSERMWFNVPISRDFSLLQRADDGLFEKLLKLIVTIHSSFVMLLKIYWHTKCIFPILLVSHLPNSISERRNIEVSSFRRGRNSLLDFLEWWSFFSRQTWLNFTCNSHISTD